MCRSRCFMSFALNYKILNLDRKEQKNEFRNTIKKLDREKCFEIKLHKEKMIHSLESLHDIIRKTFSLWQAQVSGSLSAEENGLSPEIGIRILIICSIDGCEILWTPAKQNQNNLIRWKFSRVWSKKLLLFVLLNYLQWCNWSIVGQEVHDRVKNIGLGGILCCLLWTLYVPNCLVHHISHFLLRILKM